MRDAGYVRIAAFVAAVLCAATACAQQDASPYEEDQIELPVHPLAPSELGTEQGAPLRQPMLEEFKRQFPGSLPEPRPRNYKRLLDKRLRNVA